MSRLIHTVSVVAVLAILPNPAGATNDKCKLKGQGIDHCVVLRAAAADIPAIAQQHALTVVRGLDPSDPDVVAAEGPASIPIGDTLAQLDQDPLVIDVEGVTLASLSENDAGATIDMAQLATLDAITIDGVYLGSESTYFAGDAWNGYMEQPAVSLIKQQLVRDSAVAETYGTGIVAILDTGVDPDHPLLQGALVPGYDFILDQAGIPSEWDSLDPATAAQTETNLRGIADQSFVNVLEGGGDTAVVNESTRGLVDQSFVNVLESQNLPAAFGHGTMTAGLVRLVAPGAQIMPIRVFDGDGTASTADVIEAIYFAIDHGATVINMSFSMDTNSGELARAVNRAKQAGLVCVSSAGNRGSMSLTYPAALGNVIGVASTDPQDALSPFSNYGLDLVAIAAPGEAIVSLYPGGLYAGGWGTSFSSALVSGAVTLLNKIGGTFQNINTNQAYTALTTSADPLDPATPAGAVESGRIDAQGAIVHGRYCTSSSPEPFCDPQNDH